MGWRDLGKLAKTWLENEKTELLTTDRRTREIAAAESDRAERQIKDTISSEVGYAVLERTLPPGLASMVTASRPENVAARRDTERRDRLGRRPTAALALTVSGALNGALSARLPVEITEPDQDDEWPFFGVDLESADPLPLGRDTLLELTITVPHYRGPGRYDLAEMWRRVEAGVLEEWDLMGTCLRVSDDSGDLDPLWTPQDGFGVIEVGASSLTFDLAMASAAGSTRATGGIDWSVPASG
jgi:hypothetical protein